MFVDYINKIIFEITLNIWIKYDLPKQLKLFVVFMYGIVGHYSSISF